MSPLLDHDAKVGDTAEIIITFKDHHTSWHRDTQLLGVGKINTLLQPGDDARCFVMRGDDGAAGTGCPMSRLASSWAPPCG